MVLCLLAALLARHWVDFREKHGWADEELVDEWGDDVERTDGGRRNKWKRGKMPPHVQARWASWPRATCPAQPCSTLAALRPAWALTSGPLAPSPPPPCARRYLEQIGHVKERNASMISRMQSMDKDTMDALRSYERSQRLAEILATRYIRLQVRRAPLRGAVGAQQRR